MIPEDLRQMLLLDWLTNDCLLDIQKCELASSDASFRRYFRIWVNQKTYIVMDAPPDKENLEPFLHVAKLFKSISVNVPDIFEENLTEGFLLLEDFGSRCLLDVLNAENVDSLYQNAIDVLFQLHNQKTISPNVLPSYDADLLNREMDLFHDWYLTQHLNKTIPESVWQSVKHILINSALEQPQVCVHRDYHSRNLMLTEKNEIGVIDFQDAVIGAITYDLVSLLKDCYISWSKNQINVWLDNYFLKLTQANLIDCSREQFQRWFDLMGMQRHLKAIGIFARLNWRDGKSGYLNDIPRTLTYVKNVCLDYREFKAFSDFLDTL